MTQSERFSRESQDVLRPAAVLSFSLVFQHSRKALYDFYREAPS